MLDNREGEECSGLIELLWGEVGRVCSLQMKEERSGAGLPIKDEWDFRKSMTGTRLGPNDANPFDNEVSFPQFRFPHTHEIKHNLLVSF